MAKKKSSQKRSSKGLEPAKKTIVELECSRDGGQIALKGFTYQFLYSCYLILSELKAGTIFNLEGIEDIDKIECKDADQNITHIQLKYSTGKQDASFLKDILKNFLETFLLDNTRNFKLVYDFPIANGNLSKLFANDLDEKATLYWNGIIEQIRLENSFWNWNNFVFQEFIAKLSFEKRGKDDLANKIEIGLIKVYDITTDNISIFANSIKIRCLEKMEQRASIDKCELDNLIQSVKDDISKGSQNPANSWIKRLDFHTTQVDPDLSYFEGKKATPQDIVLQLPVRRSQLEREIKDAIRDNRVTVIKAPSGQGKTTLALQVSHDLQNEYTVYQLLWCNDSKELGNIVQYFKSRVRLGEKPLILVDNLDSQLSEWNRLGQLLQEEVSFHYKLLLTTREDDWYNYSGDLSNIKAIRIIKLTLNESEARDIFMVLKKVNMLHSSITDWRKAWVNVADKKLLIEYMYLLTHGQMLSERIASQISQIGKSTTGKIKFEILRRVCFADICGVKLSIEKLIASLQNTSNDYGEVLKSIENEFLIHVNTTENYIEGLHPVRSQHIVDRLHEFVKIDETALQVVKISDERYMSKLFFNLPALILNKDKFYINVTDELWNENNLSSYIFALEGLFSGCVMQYFNHNKPLFDDANEHGGLFLVAAELSPFIKFDEFALSLNTLDDMKKIFPGNSNLEYLCKLRDKMSKLTLAKVDIYYFCKAVFFKFKNKDLTAINDIASFSNILFWLFNIDSNFNLTLNISLETIWDKKDEYSLEVISTIMYTCFCGNKDIYIHFVEKNMPMILEYLKITTKSLKLIISEDKKTIHVSYILLPSDIKKGNDESVSRLDYICKVLPIFELYCADGIKPSLKLLSSYKVPDDAHKNMPIRNIVSSFHQGFNSLWSKTILCNYECDTISEWLDHWFSIRKNIVTLFEKSSACIYRLLEGKQLGCLSTDIDSFRNNIGKKLNTEFKYPYEDRPFEEKAKIPEGFSKVKSNYFQSVLNYFNQFSGFLCRDTDVDRLAIVNLRTAQGAADKMIEFFTNICNEQVFYYKQHIELCALEKQRLETLLIACLYYQEHQSSHYFNKYQIKTWYNTKINEAMKQVENAFNLLPWEYKIIFPNKFYYDDILSYYPIIVHNLDITISDVLLEFLYGCMSFIDTSFDYLILLCKNTEDKIIPNGLKISKDFLIDIKRVIENDDEALAEDIIPPFPIAVTNQMLECFEDSYELFSQITTGYEGIDKVGELLWAYSKTRELLSDACDEKYRDSTSNNIKSEILNVLNTYKQKISPDYYDELYSICNKVFNGQQFDDNNFDEFCEKLRVLTRTARGSKL